MAKKKYTWMWLGIALVGVADIFMVIGLIALIQTRLNKSPDQTAASKTSVLSAAATPSPIPSASPAIVVPQVTGKKIMPKPIPTLPPKPNRYVGVFVSAAPDNSASIGELDSVAALGANIVYNYSSLDGSPAEITAYLDHAQALGIKVIVNLDYLIEPSGEAIALAAVGKYQAHPAVWGFGIADEKPEAPADIPKWLPVITARYQKVKQLTSKPVMAIAVGWSAANDGERRSFLRSFTPAMDTLAIDNYPIPYVPSTGIAGILADAPPTKDRWFIAQAFSWASYPDTARGLGYDLAAARTPTAGEMESMARQALSGGASSILFYSYFDIKANPAQLAALSQVIRSLRSH